jgi:RND family efflux transporter MFP subunit
MRYSMQAKRPTPAVRIAAPRALRKRAGVVAAMVAMATALAACLPEQRAAPAAHPQPVQVMTITLAPSQASASYVGTIRPRFESDLGFRVAGKVVERVVDVGQRVEAGQIIARLDPTDLQLQVEAQQAELTAARSSREQAVAAENRTRVLLAKDHVSQALLDQRVATADETRSRVERAERGLAIAQNQLGYAVLSADRAGVVSALPVETGQVVAVGQPVVRLARLDALEVEVAIPEHLADIVAGSSAEVEVWGSAKGRIAAALRELSPDADRVSRTFRARFALQPGTWVELGRTATVHVAPGSAGTVAQVPLAAVTNDGAGAHVWVLNAAGNRVTRRPVTIASLARDHVLLSSGLAAGDRIVTLGAHMLDAARPVRIVEHRTALR